MICPHCGHKKSRVTNTEDRDDFILRYRICLKCARNYTTMERVCVYIGRKAGHVEVELPAGAVEAALTPPAETVQTVQETATETVKTVTAPSPARFVASLSDELLAQCTAEVQPLLVEWWNVSRRSKHKSNATWTQKAWEASVQRVAELAPEQQIALANAGVEHGWQTLKLDYLASQLRSQPSLPPLATGRPMPKDPAMLAALESWHSPAA